MLRIRRIILRAGLCLAVSLAAAQAQPAHRVDSIEALDQFSQNVQALAARVAPSVVQVSVLRYAPSEDEQGSGRAGVVLSRQEVVGSGVIVDPGGYIVTNAHVVANALRIRVTRAVQSAPSADQSGQSADNTLAQALAAPVDAALVGVFRELDLALIRIPARGLPALPFADYAQLRQGQVVFAFGSRHGLGNSMSMGVVSSVARQPAPDSPFVYIQTDAPINPGDSGGPLVNTAGEIVGLDTFIVTQSGGSEGIGFAIPSTLIELVSKQLRRYGHMHRQLLGIGVQTITPVMASALGLPRDSGVLISDLKPGGSAASAGVKLNDIVLALDGRRVENLPMFMTLLLLHPTGQKVKLDVLRGPETLSLALASSEEAHESDRLSDLIDPEHNLVRQLGIVGIAVNAETTKMLPALRGSYGVIVGALSASSVASPSGLQVGDVIHEVNGTLTESVEALRQTMQSFKRGAAVALFIERDGMLQYLAFEIE
jgi:serine protease Do